jgi:hypothetical protein
MAISRSKRFAALGFILGLLFTLSTSALCYRGDKQGWSVIARLSISEGLSHVGAIIRWAARS